jgi:alpha-L-rhamnosidase
VAFGYLHLEVNVPGKGRKMKVLLGERGDAKHVNKKPGRSIRFHEIAQDLVSGVNALDIHPPVNIRNTSGNAIKLPEAIGTVTPYRYVEFLHCPVELGPSMIQQVAVHYPFDEGASRFESSDRMLNDIWALC